MIHAKVNNTNMNIPPLGLQPTTISSNSLMSLSPKFGSVHGELAISLKLTRWLYQLQ